MLITEYIDNRISKLESLRKQELLIDAAYSSQTWARIDELKKLKSEFTDRDRNWLI